MYYKKTWMLIFVFLFLIMIQSIILAEDSTDRTDYYYNGSHYITDNIEDTDLGLDGNPVSDDETLTSHGWALFPGKISPTYTDGYAYVGSYSMNFSKGTSANVIINIGNSTFNGSIGAMIRDIGGSCHCAISLTDMDGDIVQARIDTRYINNWQYDYQHPCNENTIIRNTTNWQPIIFNWTSSTTTEVLINGKKCHTQTSFNGLKSIQIYCTTEGGTGTKWYVDDFWVSSFSGRPAFIGASPPTIVPPTPENGETINTNVTLNVTHNTTNSDVRYWLYFSNTSDLTEDHLVIKNETHTAVEYKIWVTNMTSDGTYYFKWKVLNISTNTFSANTTLRYFTLDTVTPTIAIDESTFNLTNNLSNTNQYSDTFKINVSFIDENLFAVAINITKDGTVYFNYTNESITITALNYSRLLNISDWGAGVYDIELLASDSHHYLGGYKIKDYKVEKQFNKIRFDTSEGNTISILSEGAISTDYKKNKNSYSFGFNYLLAGTTRTFYIESNNKITYLPNSTYKAHFVVWNGRHGNWIDFRGVEGDYTVKKESDYKYKVIFKNLPKTKRLEARSIGGLNVLSLKGKWYRGTYQVIYNNPATSGSTQPFVLNITKDDNYISDISVSLFYHNETKDVTKTEYSNYYIFESEFNVPDEEGTFNFNWSVNVTQADNSKYNFTIENSQNVNFAQLNITFYDEENFTQIDYEEITVYVTKIDGNTIEKETSSGKVSFGNLSLGEYYITAESTNYPKRGIFLTISNATYSINMYLVFNKAGNDYIKYRVTNTGNDQIEDVRATFQKQINTTYVTVAQFDTDYAGQGQLFQDQQNEYKIIFSHPDYDLLTIDLLPLDTEYTITLPTKSESRYYNVYQNVMFSISPTKRVLNKTGLYENITFSVYDTDSSLEYFGLYLDNVGNFTCVPDSCKVNITGSPAGGTATVKIKLNKTGKFSAHYFFKKAGYEEQYINQNWFSVENLMQIAYNLFDFADELATNFGGEAMKIVFSIAIVSVLCVLAAQIGLFGIPLVLVASVGLIFFMLIHFINVFLGLFVLFFGIGIYVFLSEV